MKVRISYTVDVDDEFRAAIRFYYGKGGLASREEIINWVKQHGEDIDDDLMVEYRNHCLWEAGNRR